MKPAGLLDSVSYNLLREDSYLQDANHTSRTPRLRRLRIQADIPRLLHRGAKGATSLLVPFQSAPIVRQRQYFEVAISRYVLS